MAGARRPNYVGEPGRFTTTSVWSSSGVERRGVPADCLEDRLDDLDGRLACMPGDQPLQARQAELLSGR